MENVSKNINFIQIIHFYGKLEFSVKICSIGKWKYTEMGAKNRARLVYSICNLRQKDNISQLPSPKRIHFLVAVLLISKRSSKRLSLIRLYDISQVSLILKNTCIHLFLGIGNFNFITHKKSIYSKKGQYGPGLPGVLDALRNIHQEKGGQGQRYQRHHED